MKVCVLTKTRLTSSSDGKNNNKRRESLVLKWQVPQQKLNPFVVNKIYPSWFYPATNQKGKNSANHWVQCDYIQRLFLKVLKEKGPKASIKNTRADMTLNFAKSIEDNAKISFIKAK